MKNKTEKFASSKQFLSIYNIKCSEVILEYLPYRMIVAERYILS
jgi:hypothetical protein